MSTTPDALEPLADADWNEAAAAHLLRRAGFGGRPEEITALAALGPRGAVEQLVDFPAQEPELEAELTARGSDLDPDAAGARRDGRDALAVLRAAWLYRMTRTRQPLREKLALFWHGHFTSSAGKVGRAPLMARQLDTLRELGPGPFRPLVGALARDPAMLIYLDNRLNRKGQPNENWARELLELFCLGVDRYSQSDVDELSRIFTGWGSVGAELDTFAFAPDDHDSGDKHFFGAPLAGHGGEQGLAEGEQALDRIVARPECADFLAGKLLAAFAAEHWPADVQSALAETLRRNALSVREGLRVLFASAWFYAPQQRFALQRSGVEQTVAAAHLLGLQNAHAAGLEARLRRLGMELFEPPTVAGWPSGRAWVQPGALVERFHLGLSLSGIAHTRRTVLGQPAFDLDALAAGKDGGDAALVAGTTERLWQRAPGADQQQALLAYLGDCSARLVHLDERDLRRAKLRGLVHLLIAAPEFAVA